MSEGKVSRTVQVGENDTYYMYYAIKENAYEGMQGLGKGNITSLKDVFLIDDKLNVRYIANNGKEYGDNLDNKVLEDETDIRFSSKAFSEYVSKISGVKEEEMKFKWMKKQTSLTITDPNVDSLQDLVFFPNLTSLRLETLNLENLDGIENCVKLTIFSTFGTKIKDHMKLSILPVLKNVYIASDADFNNIIDSLKSVETLKQFNMLAANNTKTTKRISELNDGLESLCLRLNNIEKIEGLENKINLRYLDLKNNKIQKIEGLENCINLKYLYLDSNKITKIENIEMLQNLNELFLSSNQLTDILNADKNDKLTYLNLLKNPNIKSNRNEYTEEENKRLDKIQEILTVRNGKIDIDADQLRLFSGYKTINLINSDISTLEVLEGQTELEVLSLWGCTNITLTDIKSQEILKSMKKLKTLNLSRTDVKDLTAINELGNLTKLTLDTKNILDLSQMEDVISQVHIELLKQDELNSILKCDNQKITKLSFTGQITMLPDISIFPNLNTLILGGHQKISNFDIVSKCTNLVELNLVNTNLHERMIDFSKLTKLTKLDLSNNALWSEDLEYLKVLKNNKNLSIYLRDNSIIDASALLELDKSSYIDLRNNVNLTQESKDKLKARFGQNLSF